MDDSPPAQEPLATEESKRSRYPRDSTFSWLALLSPILFIICALLMAVFIKGHNEGFLAFPNSLEAILIAFPCFCLLSLVTAVIAFIRGERLRHICLIVSVPATLLLVAMGAWIVESLRY